MAKNKITFEKTYDDTCRAIYRFTGSQRQPTMNEIDEFIDEKMRSSDFDDAFMVYAMKCQRDDCGYQGGFGSETINKTVEFWGYDGGMNDGSCPICGKERDLSGKYCPVCLKPWE